MMKEEDWEIVLKHIEEKANVNIIRTKTNNNHEEEKEIRNTLTPKR